jgi:WD40 repeat protein
VNEPEAEQRVDPEHPWPALLSFREDDRRYFGGRGEEVAALYRRIVSSRLTLLFGLSGLGKTSLLRAGLFPRLREEHYFPVYIRLRFGKDLPTPVEQIKAEIVAQAQAARIEAPEPRAGETLWQYFHRPDADFWDERNYPSTPVLVFDQFEELFTKSREVAEHANEVIEQLADLAEGASPALMRQTAQTDRALLKQVFEDRYRLLIGIRSDYLAQLQAISDRVRAVFANRYELHRMTGAAALESTLTAGKHLLDEDVARRIVRFVAGAKESDDSLSVDGLEVEPALLSLVCSELNTTRIRNGEPAITASMLSGTKDEILSRFYEASFADVAPELRVLVEDKLVTRDGKGRNFISEQTARETAGVTEEDLAKLVHRRLLRFEESGSSRRMELTHDLLTAVAAASRATREQRRALEEAQAARAEAEQREATAHRALRRSRAAMLVFFVLLALAVAGPFIAARWTATGAKKVEADSAFRLALQKLSSDEPTEGLAYLARVIRLDRGNAAARTLLYSQLVTRSWPIPIRSFGPAGHIDAAVFSADGARVVFRVDATVEMWDVATGRQLGSRNIGFQPEWMLFASDGWTVLFDPRSYVTFAGPNVALWNPRTDRPTFNDVAARFRAAGCGNYRVFDVSPDGRELIAACQLKRVIVPLAAERPFQTIGAAGEEAKRSRFAPDPRFLTDGETIVERRGAEVLVRELETGQAADAFSRSGSVAIVDRERAVEVRDLRGWQTVGTKFSTHSAVRSTGFDTTGGTLMTVAADNAVRVWDVASGQMLYDPLWHDDITAAGFSPDDARLFAASDRLARWWGAHEGTQLGTTIAEPQMVAAQTDAFGNIVTVSTAARVWQLATVLFPPLSPADSQVTGFSADGSVAAAVALEDLKMSAFDTTTGRSLWTQTGAVSVLAFDRQLSRMVVVDGRTIALVDARTSRRVWTVPAKDGTRADFSVDGKAVLTFDAAGITVRSAETGAPVAPPIDGTGRSLLAKSDDGSVLAFQSKEKVVVWDVRKSRERLAIPRADAVTFSPDGKHLAAIVAREVRLWMLDSGDVRTMKRKVGEKPTGLTFSPDGKHLAVTSDHAVTLCNVDSFDCAADVLTDANVATVRFSTDGRRVLTQTPKEIHVWDVATRRPVALPLTDHDGPAAFSPDGTALLAVSNGELHRIPLPSVPDDDAELLAQLAEAIAGVRVDRLGTTEPVDGTKTLSDLARQCRAVKSEACRIVTWFVTPAATRTVSPVSNVRVADYIKRQMQTTKLDWWHFKALFPTEPTLRPRN